MDKSLNYLKKARISLYLFIASFVIGAIFYLTRQIIPLLIIALFTIVVCIYVVVISIKNNQAMKGQLKNTEVMGAIVAYHNIVEALVELVKEKQCSQDDLQRSKPRLKACLNDLFLKVSLLKNQDILPTIQSYIEVSKQVLDYVEVHLDDYDVESIEPLNIRRKELLKTIFDYYF